MKKLLACMALISLVWGASAQSSSRKGIALGADRDTMLYIIASPFDNWFITLGAGAQTYIGNEVYAENRKNNLNYNLKVEVGKWLLPDIAVSLQLGFCNINGQTADAGRHPFVYYSDWSLNGAISPDADEYTTYANYGNPNEDFKYFNYKAHAAQLMGFVTLDWTNFLLGYETGKRSYFHVYTPIGLGTSMFFGKQRNASVSLHRDGFEKGDFRRNFELAYSVGLGVEYEASPSVALHLNANLLGTRGSHDWSTHNKEDVVNTTNYYSIFDFMPSINIGVRFNLFSEVTKYNPYTKQSTRTKVNHEFLSFGSQTTVPTLKGRIQRLNARLDSLQTLSDERSHHDSILILQLKEEISRLDTLTMTQTETLQPGKATEVNIFDDILALNQILDLPSTIIYFPLNGYTLNDVNRRKLQNFMTRIDEIRDTAEFYVIGAADAETGTPRINKHLSEQRCKSVHQHLVTHFEMNDKQLTNAPMGGVAGYGEKNRMSMIILKTPAIQAIVERWRHTP